MNGRETALQALVACRRDGAWSNGILKDYTQRAGLDRREAALAARLCYGVLQNRGLLDFYLKQLLTGKLSALHPALRDVLHLGLYQLWFMDKIPASAAVNESVALARKVCPKQSFAPGLCNAVLRRAAQGREGLRQPTRLCDKYSHPQKLIDLLGAYVGKDRLEPMLRANNEAPPTVAQVNTLRTTARALVDRLRAEGVEARPHGWMPDCLVLEATGDLEKLPSFQEGLFYIQDAAARLAVLCAQLPQREDFRLLDCCAAPGGKSFAAAIAMGGKGRVLACDVHSHKTALLEKGAQRLGLPGVQVFCQDATAPRPQWEASMDAVIADVPCSGYGIIRKKPDIRYKDPSQMEDLPALQRQILERQATYVKPGGLLIYATCTLVYGENEALVKGFLEDHPEFAPEPLPLPAPLPKNSSGMLHLVPGEYDTDGFFIARLRRAL